MWIITRKEKWVEIAVMLLFSGEWTNGVFFFSSLCGQRELSNLSLCQAERQKKKKKRIFDCLIMTVRLKQQVA